MLDLFVSFFEMFWALFKIPLFFLGIICAVMGFCCGIYIIRNHYAGRRFKQGEHNRVKRPGFFRSFFVLAPKQFVEDLYNRDPEYFRHQGCVIFTGRQGSGKTIAMVEQALQYQAEYPKCKVISNCDYIHQNDTLSHWKQLLDYKNGIQGVAVMMDEMQNWFSSNQSKNFPPEMLTVITQNRKNRRVILGTSQVFSRLSKPLREQTTEVRRCFTILGCITFVHRVEPEIDSEGNVERWKHRGFYYFVHSKQIRESYDTYRVIDSLSASGFQEAKPIQER